MNFKIRYLLNIIVLAQIQSKTYFYILTDVNINELLNEPGVVKLDLHTIFQLWSSSSFGKFLVNLPHLNRFLLLQ